MLAATSSGNGTRVVRRAQLRVGRDCRARRASRLAMAWENDRGGIATRVGFRIDPSRRRGRWETGCLRGVGADLVEWGMPTRSGLPVGSGWI